jgi:hypothetical protein
MRNRDIVWYTTGLVIGSVLVTGRTVASWFRRYLTEDPTRRPVAGGPARHSPYPSSVPPDGLAGRRRRSRPVRANGSARSRPVAVFWT